MTLANMKFFMNLTQDSLPAQELQASWDRVLFDPCSAARCVPACPMPRVVSRFGVNEAGAHPWNREHLVIAGGVVCRSLSLRMQSFEKGEERGCLGWA